MAIAFDTSTTPSARSNSWTTMTQAHTCSGSDRILFVVTGNNLAGTTCSWVTYNWVAMTNIGWDTVNSNNSHMKLWYLIAPATGSNNVVATFTASCVSMMQIVSYTWANQSSQPDASVVSSITSNTFTQSLTTISDNCWIILANMAMSWWTQTAWSNAFIRIQNEALAFWLWIADTNSSQTPAWSKSMTINSTISQPFNWIMASFSPSGGASPQTNPAFIYNFI